MSPIRDADAKRRYQRESMARRRAAFFADKVCVDCGASQELELDRRDPAGDVNHRIWSWSSSRRTAELARYDIRCATCRRKAI